AQGLRIVLEILRASRVFNLHIAKLFGIEDFATLQALDKLGVFVPGNDPDPRMSAGARHRSRGFVPLNNPHWMSPFRPPAARRRSGEGQPPSSGQGCLTGRIGVQPTRDCDWCSIRKIVAVFWAIANPFLMKVTAGIADFPRRQGATASLKDKRKRTYTKYGPFQSHISC